ncbi:MAG TPA: acyl carrier protein [Pyrinomonadaceae bacterium]|nr:acyl carrier protein [Pyrinomonadaceae bacterium]
MDATERNELRKMIAELIEVDDFSDDEHFVRDLGVDSMMALEIVSRIEKRYGIRISEESLRQIATFNDVVNITEGAIAKAAVS